MYAHIYFRLEVLSCHPYARLDLATNVSTRHVLNLARNAVSASNGNGTETRLLRRVLASLPRVSEMGNVLVVVGLGSTEDFEEDFGWLANSRSSDLET